MDALGLTSGTVSVRLDRLEHNGIVSREPDPANARDSLVRLTGKGLKLFDEIAPVHLANEDRLLAALSPAEREDLADLLRRLLAGFEPATTSNAAADLGLTLEPAHLARQRRQAVGLSAVPGLLITEVTAGSAAARAGLERGDLLTAIEGKPTTSSVTVAAILDDREPSAAITATVLRGNQPMTVRLHHQPTRG
jgi:predicted metalloprotease with PDZ domain